MTKRRVKIEEAVVVGEVTAPSPVETAVALPAEVAVERARFTVGVWHELPMWRCTACPFDTLEGEAAMLEHWQIKHGPPPELPKLVQAYDASGRPIP